MNADVIIIGAGIVGLACARELQRRCPELRVLVLEKEAAPAQHQTGRNSGVIHAGVYYPPGSLKATLCREGNQAVREFCDTHGIAYDICGKLLVACSGAELERMRGLYERCAANALERCWLDAAELRRREPHITGLAGILIPSTGIVSYRAICEKMAALIHADGGEIRYGETVQRIEESAAHVSIRTSRSAYQAERLIACAGLQADILVRAAGLVPDFTICPFRGEYYQLPAKHNRLIKHLIYPIPEPDVPFLGVHLTRMIDGSITVGPSAVLAMAREGYHKTDISPRDLLHMLGHQGIRKVLRKNWKHGLKEQKNAWCKSSYLKEVQKYCPEITTADLLPYPAGVRAQAVSNEGELIEDFLWKQTARMLHVCNAPSPAATAAIPIARRIIDQLEAPASDSSA